MLLSMPMLLSSCIGRVVCCAARALVWFDRCLHGTVTGKVGRLAAAKLAQLTSNRCLQAQFKGNASIVDERLKTVDLLRTLTPFFYSRALSIARPAEMTVGCRLRVRGGAFVYLGFGAAHRVLACTAFGASWRVGAFCLLTCPPSAPRIATTKPCGLVF